MTLNLMSMGRGIPGGQDVIKEIPQETPSFALITKRS